MLFASTMVALPGGQAGSREAGGDLWLDAALLGLWLVGGSPQMKFWGPAVAGGQIWMGIVYGLVLFCWENQC